MTQSHLAVSRFRLRNFKAVRDSGFIKFTPLTVFIGNNGVGKSSLIEGLEMMSLIADDGLDKAMQRWRGFEYIWNKASEQSDEENDTEEHNSDMSPNGREYQKTPMGFQLFGYRWEDNNDENAVLASYRASTIIAAEPGFNEIFFLHEKLRYRTYRRSVYKAFRTDNDNVVGGNTGFSNIAKPILPDRSILSDVPVVQNWQFVRLNPDVMSKERQIRRVKGYITLDQDGSNIAEYLLDILNKDASTVDGIVETLQTVLPYAEDVQPTVASEIGRSAYLQLTEQGFKLPGWLFSTGTLRIVALLALFRHPSPPPLIVIEELENGLDPRTVSLIIEEIREVVRSGTSQVIITTHSPYLLNLVPLKSLVFVERIDGQPRFSRPGDEESIQRWSEDFAPGDLYTMGRFRKDS